MTWATGVRFTGLHVSEYLFWILLITIISGEFAVFGTLSALLHSYYYLSSTSLIATSGYALLSYRNWSWTADKLTRRHLDLSLETSDDYAIPFLANIANVTSHQLATVLSLHA